MIVLSASQRAQIEVAALRAYPLECCGLLVGHDTSTGIVVKRVVESRNVRTDRARDRFEVDPQLRISLERELRGRAERVIGHYHSHPDHPAVPSATDIDLAFEPNLIWVIVGVRQGDATDINAFTVDRQRGSVKRIELVVNAEP